MADTETFKYSSIFTLTAEFREKHQIDDFELYEAQNSLHAAHQAWLSVMGPDDTISLNSVTHVEFEQLIVGLGMAYTDEMLGEKLRQRAEKDGGELTMLAFIDWYVRYLYFADDEEEDEY